MRLKLKNLISILLVFILALSALAPAALAGTEPTEWAKNEVNKANTSGILTDSAAADYQRKMTREQYSELAVRMVERTLGRALSPSSGNPFSDARSEHVLKAYQYGLVEGIGEGKFNPNAPITREQIATLMIRALDNMQKDLGKTLLTPPASSLTFGDASKVSDWARESMRYAVANGIFQGDQNNNVNPQDEITSQECVVVAVRSYSASQEKIDAGLTTTQLIDKAADNINIGYALGDLPTAVSRNIILPTSGAGGTKITWYSGNPSVIDSSGRVTTRPGGTVTLTATLTLGGLSRTKSFALTTTTLTGDQLAVSNAKTALELGFANSGDSVDYVTGRVFLPDTVLGLPVTWYSDTPAVVSANGDVTPPGDSREITVNLQASFKSGSATGAKLFVLKVRNPAYTSGAVSLHNVSLGMTSSQVTSALGSYKTALTLASGETWRLYYSSATSYNNFIAVAFQSDRVVGVYTMVQGWENYLRDAQSTRVITVAEANGVENTSLTVFTDTRGGNASYAAFLADTSSTVDNVRTLTADGAETFTLALVNAFRARNSRAALSDDSVLARSARLHSADMGQYVYFSATGRTGTTYQTRANSAASSLGVTSPTVEGGFIGNNTINPFNYLDIAVNSATDRALIVSSTATSVGAGFAGGYSGTYRDLLTVVFGKGSLVTGVTLTVNNVQQSSVSVNLNGTQNITLTFSPTNATENVTVSSSNTNIFTLAQYSSYTANTRTYTVTGKALTSSYGSASIIVYGADGRVITSFPVTVGNTYATSLTVRDEANSVVTGSATTGTATATKTYVLGVGNTYTFTATPAYSGTAPTVTWSSNNANIASVNNGYVTGVGAGTTTIYASVPKSDGTTIRVTINVIVVSGITLNPASLTVASGETKTATIGVSGTLPANLAYGPYSIISGGSGSYATATISGATINVTGNAQQGNQSIVVSATLTGSALSSYVSKITKTLSVTVAGRAQYPTGATLSIEGGTLGVYQTKQITVTPNNNALNVNVINWNSDNTAIATVGSDGKVKGVSIGSTIIRGMLQTQQTPTQEYTPVSFTVNVTAANPTITVAPAGPLTLTVGGSTPIAYTFDPTYEVAQFAVGWNQSTGSESVFSIVSTGVGNTCTIKAIDVGTGVIVWAEINGTSIKSNPVSVTVNAAVGGNP